MKYENNEILFIIGAQKAGTTWLREILIQIAFFRTPSIKEINFYLTRSWTLEHRKNQLINLEKDSFQVDFSKKIRSKILNDENISFEDYCEILNLSNDSISIDNSPFYSTLNQIEIKRILEDFPRAKFLYILRNPLDRLLSDANMQGIKIFDRQHFLEIEKHTGLLYQSNYRHNVQNYVTVCPDQLLLLDFADISRDPLNFINKLLVFLGVQISNEMLYSLKDIDKKVFHYPDKKLNQHCLPFLNELLADDLVFYDHIFNRRILYD